MRIIEDTKLDFSDVLISPKRSQLTSRKDADLTRTFTFKHSRHNWSGIPIIASNMDHTGTNAMAMFLWNTLCLQHYVSLSNLQSGDGTRT